jgi:hypothetical protein
VVLASADLMRPCLALGLLACASTAAYTRAPQPCQAEVVDVVWRGAYGRTDPPPDIWWVPPAGQGCTMDHLGTRGMPADVPTGTVCAMARAWGGDAVWLIWYPQWKGLTWRNLAHELEHVVQARNGEPPDWAHATAGFQPGGAVAQAQARLAGTACAEAR